MILDKDSSLRGEIPLVNHGYSSPVGPPIGYCCWCPSYWVVLDRYPSDIYDIDATNVREYCSSGTCRCFLRAPFVADRNFGDGPGFSLLHNVFARIPVGDCLTGFFCHGYFFHTGEILVLSYRCIVYDLYCRPYLSYDPYCHLDTGYYS